MPQDVLIRGDVLGRADHAIGNVLVTILPVDSQVGPGKYGDLFTLAQFKIVTYELEVFTFVVLSDQPLEKVLIQRY